MTFKIQPLDPVTFAKYWTPPVIEAAIEAELYVDDSWLTRVREGKENFPWAVDEDRGWACKFMSNADRLRNANAYLLATSTNEYCVFRYAGYDKESDSSLLRIDLISPYFKGRSDAFIKGMLEAFEIGGVMLAGKHNSDGTLRIPYGNIKFINL